AAATRHTVCAALQRLLNWGVKKKVISANPFAGVTFPSESRGRAMTPEEFRCLLRQAPAFVRRILFFIAYTGCRPCEARKARWSDVDVSGQRPVIRFQHHKTSRSQRVKRDRVLTLIPLLVRLHEWLRRQNRGPVGNDACIELIRSFLADR